MALDKKSFFQFLDMYSVGGMRGNAYTLSFFPLSESSGVFNAINTVPSFDTDGQDYLTASGGVTRSLLNSAGSELLLGNEVILDGVTGTKLDITFPVQASVNQYQLCSFIVKVDDLLSVQPLVSVVGTSGATVGVYIDTDGVIKVVHFDGASTYTVDADDSSHEDYLSLVAGQHYHMTFGFSKSNGDIDFGVISLNAELKQRFSYSKNFTTPASVGSSWGVDMDISVFGEHNADFGSGVVTESLAGTLSSIALYQTSYAPVQNIQGTEHALAILGGHRSAVDFDVATQVLSKLGGTLVYDFKLSPVLPNRGANPTTRQASELISGDAWLYTNSAVTNSNYTDGSLTSDSRDFLTLQTTGELESSASANLAELTTNWLMQFTVYSTVDNSRVFTNLDDFGICRLEDATTLNYIVLEHRSGSIRLLVKDGGAEEVFFVLGIDNARGLSNGLLTMYVEDDTNIKIVMRRANYRGDYVLRVKLATPLTSAFKLVKLGSTGTTDSGLLSTVGNNNSEVRITAPRVWSLSAPLSLVNLSTIHGHAYAKPNAGRFIYKNSYTLPCPAIDASVKYPVIPLTTQQLLDLPLLGAFDSLRFTLDDGDGVTEVFEVYRITSTGLILRRALEDTIAVTWLAGTLENRLTDEALRSMVSRPQDNQLSNNASSIIENRNVSGFGVEPTAQGEHGLSERISNTGNSFFAGNNAFSGSPRSSVIIGFDQFVFSNRAVAIGTKNEVQGYQAVCIGHYNLHHSNSLSSSSVTIGKENYAYGDVQIAIGLSNRCWGGSPYDPGIAIGKNCKTGEYGVANTSYGIAIGNGAFAYGYHSRVIGTYATCSGYRGILIGDYGDCQGRHGVRIGYLGDCNGEYGTSVGYQCQARGSKSAAFGYSAFVDAAAARSIAIGDTSVYGADSVVIGNKSSSSTGSRNIAIGYNNDTTGTSASSTVVGVNNTNAADDTILIGKNNSITTSNFGSVAIGAGNNVTSQNSMAFGQGNTLSGGQTKGFGVFLTLSGYHAIGIGKSIVAAGSESILIGNDLNDFSGASDNAIFIGSDIVPTEEVYRGIFLGTNHTNGGGQNNILIGSNCSITTDKNNAIVIGNASGVSAIDALAIGTVANADGNFSVSIGRSAAATGAESIAIGYNAVASQDNIINMAGIPSIRQANTINGFSGSELKSLSGSQAILSFDAMDGTAGGVAESVNLPTGFKFIPQRLIVIVVAADTVTVQPFIEFKSDSPNLDMVSSVQCTGLDAVGKYQAFEAPFVNSNQAVDSLRFSVITGGTATTLTIRPIFIGTVIEF